MDIGGPQTSRQYRAPLNSAQIPVSMPGSQ